MTTDAAIRIASLCIVLAGAETLHGIARTGHYLSLGLVFLTLAPLWVAWARGAL